MRYLAMCCIVKDETPYVREWVEYHALLGAEHFIVFDNNSAEPVSRTLRTYTESGLVRVIKVDGLDRQIPCYTECLKEFGPEFRWIGFIDADEFVQLNGVEDMRVLLSEYEDFGGLALNWAVFSSSGHETRPNGLQIESYFERFPDNYPADWNVKSFVRPDRAVRCLSPHSFEYAPGCFCVNEERMPVPGNFSPQSMRRGRINHYFFRSRQEFEEKAERWKEHNEGVTSRLVMESFDRQAEFSTLRDESMLPMAARLKALPEDEARRAEILAPGPDSSLELHEYAALAVSRIAKNDLRTAETLLCAASLRFDNCAELWTLRASVARFAGRLDEAERRIRRALTLDYSLDAYHELFLIELDRGRIEQACALLDFIPRLAERTAQAGAVPGRDWNAQIIRSRALLNERLKDNTTP